MSDLPLIPGLTLEHWQRRDLVLLALHASCSACEALTRALDPLPASLTSPELSVVVLRDDDPRWTEERARRLEGAAQAPEGSAFAIVADRFARIFMTFDVHALTTEALVRELGEWTESVQLQCGECSVSGEEAPLTGG